VSYQNDNNNNPINITEQRARFEAVVGRDIESLKIQSDKSDVRLQLLNDRLLLLINADEAKSRDIESLKNDRRWVVTIVLGVVIVAILSLVVFRQGENTAKINNSQPSGITK